VSARRQFRAGLILCACLPAVAALAYGPEGHLIAGRAAAPLLCARATAEVARLGGGGDLGEIGLWADRIRSNAAYADAAPWHYVNVADGAALAAHESSSEGDILWAIAHFDMRIRDSRLNDTERGEALRFLVHFVVDLHQPLHVGLAEDRGGNEVELVYGGEATNLHRLWDADVIDRAGLALAAYTAQVTQRAAGIDGGEVLDPKVWAAESLVLRPAVYAFGRAGREPPAAYLDRAAAITEERLTLAAARLAGTLNSIFCP
jgi:hypothetical protein